MFTFTDEKGNKVEIVGEPVTELIKKWAIEGKFDGGVIERNGYNLDNMISEIYETHLRGKDIQSIKESIDKESAFFEENMDYIRKTYEKVFAAIAEVSRLCKIIEQKYPLSDLDRKFLANPNAKLGFFENFKVNSAYRNNLQEKINKRMQILEIIEAKKEEIDILTGKLDSFFKESSEKMEKINALYESGEEYNKQNLFLLELQRLKKACISKSEPIEGTDGYTRVIKP